MSSPEENRRSSSSFLLVAGEDKKMLYVDHGEGGPPEVMRLREGNRPALLPGQVLIRVAYAGINRPDVVQRAGAYPPPPDASKVLGLEVAGEIVETASDVSDLAVHEQVCALTPGGGYAEFCAAPAAHCLPIPAGLSLLEAAALPENYFTVWGNVFDRGRLERSENFLVHGGSSGIGIAAIQLAKALGACVFTTVGSAEKAAFCQKIGADFAFNYRELDFLEEIEKETRGQGVQVILDMVGGEYFAKNLKALAIEGRLVQIAFLLGSEVRVDLRSLLVKRLILTGSTLRAQSKAQKAAIADRLRKTVWPLLEAGRVKPVIQKVYPLSEVVEAHAAMERGGHIGKLMLQVAA